MENDSLTNFERHFWAHFYPAQSKTPVQSFKIPGCWLLWNLIDIDLGIPKVLFSMKFSLSQIINQIISNHISDWFGIGLNSHNWFGLLQCIVETVFRIPMNEMCIEIEIEEKKRHFTILNASSFDIRCIRIRIVFGYMVRR